MTQEITPYSSTVTRRTAHRGADRAAHGHALLRELRELKTREDRKAFLLNLICFAACIEGLFFYGAFATCTTCAPAGCCTSSRPMAVVAIVAGAEQLAGAMREGFATLSGPGRVSVPK